MVLNPSNSSNLNQLALKGLITVVTVGMGSVCVVILRKWKGVLHEIKK